VVLHRRERARTVARAFLTATPLVLQPKENQVKVKQEAIESVSTQTKIQDHFQHSKMIEDWKEMPGGAGEAEIGDDNEISEKEEYRSGSDLGHENNEGYEGYVIDGTDSSDEEFSLGDEELKYLETELMSSGKKWLRISNGC